MSQSSCWFYDLTLKHSHQSCVGSLSFQQLLSLLKKMNKLLGLKNSTPANLFLLCLFYFYFYFLAPFLQQQHQKLMSFNFVTEIIILLSCRSTEKWKIRILLPQGLRRTLNLLCFSTWIFGRTEFPAHSAPSLCLPIMILPTYTKIATKHSLCCPVKKV